MTTTSLLRRPLAPGDPGAGSVEEIGIYRPTPPASPTTFETALLEGRRDVVAAAPWHSQEEQAEAAQREAPKPLPGFEALYNPFGSALPNARRHSKPGQAPDYKWVGAQPAIRPLRAPKAEREMQLTRIANGRRQRQEHRSAAKARAAATDRALRPPADGHYIDRIGAIRAADGTLGAREKWRPTLEGLGVQPMVYRQPDCRPERQDTSWRVFGSYGNKPLVNNPVERVMTGRRARPSSALMRARQAAANAQFMHAGTYAPPSYRGPPPDQPPSKWGTQKGLSRSLPAPLSDTHLQPITDVHGNLDKDHRDNRADMHRDDSHRTLVSPTFSDPQHQHHSSLYATRDPANSRSYGAQPPRQEPYMEGAKETKKGEPVFSQMSTWDDVIGTDGYPVVKDKQRADMKK